MAPPPGPPEDGDGAGRRPPSNADGSLTQPGGPKHRERTPSGTANPRVTPSGGTRKASSPANPAAKGTAPKTTPAAGRPAVRTTSSGGSPKARMTPSGGSPVARGPPSREVRALSAARNASPTRAGPQPLAKRLSQQAIDTGLNVWGFLRDAYEGFRRSDTYFKYRVLIVVTWAVLSASGMGVACPGRAGDSNPLGARLVVSFVGDQPVFMIVNESNDTWEDVRLIANDHYGASVVRVAPGSEVTVGVTKLIDESGRPAPASLHVERLVIKTSDEKVVLVRDGKLPIATK